MAIGSGNEPEIRNQTKWSFYWKGHMLYLRLDLMDAFGRRGEPGWSHWKLVWLNGSHGLPKELKSHADEILQDLQSALVAYKGSGMHSKSTDYTITFEIDKECIL